MPHVLAWLTDPLNGAVKEAPVQVVALPSSMLPLDKDGKVRPKQPDKPKPPELAKKDKEKDKPADLNGQVVDIPPTADDRPPEESKYLSEHNTRAEHETKSRHQSQDYQNAMNEPTVAKRRDKDSAPAQLDAKAIDIGPPTPSQEQKKAGTGQDKAFELPRLEARDDLALRYDPHGTLRNQRATDGLPGTGDRLRLSLGDDEDKPSEPGRAPKAGPATLELVPKLGVLAALTGAPSNDHLEDLDEGEGTFLNSREFKFASFFNRMKRGVSEHWRPLDEYRRRDPSGNIYGYRSRVTVLNVILNPDGTLKDVKVERSSGVDFLDREAIAAFERAGPFPNPPKGLIDASTGQITFPFGFHIDFSPGRL